MEQLVSGETPCRLAVWGYQWDHLSWNSPLRPYTRFAAVPWEEYGRLIRSAKINLVFLTRFDTGRSVVPLRLFEIPAAGGFMLVERGLGQAAEFFREGEELACFDDIADLKKRSPIIFPGTRRGGGSPSPRNGARLKAVISTTEKWSG